MIAAVGDSGCGAGSALAFWSETDLSWESASRAILLSWRDFQDEIPENGSGDYLNLFYGMYLRDRCILLADWLDVRAYLRSELSSCWEDEDAGFNLEAPGDGSYWNQGQEITETEFEACLAQYAQRARLDGGEGPIFWRPNSKTELLDRLLP